MREEMLIADCRSIQGMGENGMFHFLRDIFFFWKKIEAAFAKIIAASSRAEQASAPEDAVCVPGNQEIRNRQAEKLLDLYGSRILRLAYSYLHQMSDAEDILQETLIQWMKTQPVFESNEHAKAWLLHVAANLCKNRIEYRKLRETDELNEELIAEEREDLSFVWEAVKALPDHLRAPIHLFYQEGLSTAEIAQILQEREGTVRAHLNRGRARLKKVLKEAYDFE